MVKVKDAGLKFNGTLKPLKKINKIIVHHPAHPTWDIHDIHRSHQAKGWIGIGYNYMVTKNKEVFLGRGYNEGAHCKGSGMNDESLGVTFQGNYEIEIPSEDIYRTGAEFIAHLLLDTGLSIHDVQPHKKYDATACPGKNFDMDKLRTYVLEYMNPKAKVEQAPKEEVKSVIVKGGKTVVKKGDSGKIVKTIQTLVGSSADGKFGPNTESRVKAFQKREGLAQDGIVGKGTWKALTGDEGGLLH